MTAAPTSLHLEALEELLRPHGLTSLDVLAQTFEGCGSRETDDVLLTAVQLLAQQLTAERQAQQLVVQRYDDLRLRCARKEASLHRAHEVVARKAMTYHDDSLAKVAHEQLHGRTYQDALDALPTAQTLLKLGQQRLVG